MLVLESSLVFILPIILRGNITLVPLCILSGIYFNAYLSPNSLYIIGGFSNLTNLLTNTSINYYLLSLSITIFLIGVFFSYLSNVFLVIVLCYSSTILSDKYNTHFAFLNTPDSLINLDLFNGMLSIHPWILLMSISLILVLLSFTLIVTLNQGSLSYDKNIPYDLVNLDKPKKTKIYNSFFKIRKLSLNTLYMNIISIILGALWAHQELSWGGYWSWDPIEVFSLITLAVALILSHSIKKDKSIALVLALLILIVLVLALVRLNAVSSIHGFLDIQDVRFSISSFFLFITTISMLIYFNFVKLFIGLKKNHIHSYESNKLPNSASIAILYLNSIFLIFSLIYVIFILISNSIKPVSYEIFVFSSLYLVITSLLFKWSVYYIMFPILEALVITSLSNSYRFYFFTKSVHFVIILLLIFFINHSHIFFVELINFPHVEELTYTNTDLLVVSSSFFHYLSSIWDLFNNVSVVFYNNVHFISNLPIQFINQHNKTINNQNEQFSTLVLNGLDYTYFGSNFFFKITNTYTLYLITLFWLLTFLINSKLKKKYIF